ncbi:MAG: hypothetical protein ACRDND_24815, partial [Streptosporangiaceae bacterium]
MDSTDSVDSTDSTDSVGGRGLAVAMRGVLGPVTVDGLTRLSGGASRETWSFDAVSPDGTRTGLVLRRDPPGRPSEPGTMSREATVIGQALAAGLAVPEVLLSTEEPDRCARRSA